MELETYHKKRNFSHTPEPKGQPKKRTGPLQFVVQRHEATKLHYDFRLELGGVLKSWAVPKGPSLNPSDKRLAVETEDHPLSYASFEGDIPEGNYGAGHVDIWDQGSYHAAETEDPEESEKLLLQGLEAGSVSFVLEGEKLQGTFSMVRMKGRQKGAWLLIKKKDQAAVAEDYESEEHLQDISPGQKRTAAGTEKLKADKPQAKKAQAKKKKSKAASGAPEMAHDLQPMKAKLTDGPFDGDDWIFEIKWDGYRAIAELQDGQVALYSRSGKSYGDKYPPVVESLKELGIGQEMVLDGEIVVLDDEGHSSFQQLQNYQNSPSEHLYFYVFDLLYLNGEDLRSLPLLERKQKLAALLNQDLLAVRYSDHIKGKGKDFFKEAQRKNIEGIMAKKADSPYRTGKRSSEWLKIKTHLRQEAVIGGFTAPKGTRKHIGALVLGVYQEAKLTYVGQCGSGFNSQSLKTLKEKLNPLVQEISPFAEQLKPNAPVSWVKPVLVAEISFAEWTEGGLMRQAIFQGLREDKKPEEVVRESAEPTEKAEKKTEAPKLAASGRKRGKESKSTEKQIEGQVVLLSSLDKVYWPEENISKGELIEYYQSIAEVLLPYLQDRPQSLLRHPAGILKPGFVQKDVPHAPDWVRTEKIKAETTGEDVEYLLCENKASLAYMNNLGCIQLNPWNSRVTKLQQPDYMVMDLDPGNNTFDQVVEVALATKEVLDRACATAFCKTSGATGIHIFVPLEAKYSFEQARQFAHIVGQLVHEKLPKLTSLERNPEKRRRQVYLDYLQNSIGQTMAAVYSARPRPGAPVSTPLAWEELKKGLHPSSFNIRNIPGRLKEKGDLFKGVLGKGIDLLACLEKLS